METKRPQRPTEKPTGYSNLPPPEALLFLLVGFLLGYIITHI